MRSRSSFTRVFRGNSGDPWWRNPQAGAFLKEEFWKSGNKLQGDEVAQILGYEEIDWGAFEREIGRRLAYAKSIPER